MKQLMVVGGQVAAVVGVLICVVAGLVRVSGGYHLAGFETQTLFMAGIAGMVLACVLRLYSSD